MSFTFSPEFHSFHTERSFRTANSQAAGPSPRRDNTRVQTSAGGAIAEANRSAIPAVMDRLITLPTSGPPQLPHPATDEEASTPPAATPTTDAATPATVGHGSARSHRTRIQVSDQACTTGSPTAAPVTREPASAIAAATPIDVMDWLITLPTPGLPAPATHEEASTPPAATPITDAATPAIAAPASAAATPATVRRGSARSHRTRIQVSGQACTIGSSTAASAIAAPAPAPVVEAALTAAARLDDELPTPAVLPPAGRGSARLHRRHSPTCSHRRGYIQIVGPTTPALPPPAPAGSAIVRGVYAIGRAFRSIGRAFLSCWDALKPRESPASGGPSTY